VCINIYVLNTAETPAVASLSKHFNATNSMSAKLEVATEVFCNITLCWLVSSHRRLEGDFYLHLQYDPRMLVGLPCRLVLHASS